MSSKPLKVFVYGTLKVGGRFAERFNDLRLSNKPGKIKGTMFNIHNSFPGVVLNGDTTITGEVHEYAEPEKVERSLDNIEGFIKEDHPNNLYNKVEVVVETEEGVEQCKMYTFAKNANGHKKVETGIWEIGK